MKLARLLCPSLIICIMFALGCGSGNGDSSYSGTGAVATAFVKSGDVQILHPDGTPWGSVFAGAVSNSLITLDVPAEIQPPFIVQVNENAILQVGTDENDTSVLRSPLSRVVLSNADLSKLYVTAFSTIKAKTYIEATKAMQNGMDVDPVAVASNALTATLEALNIKLDGDIEELDPRESVDLEFAQQSLFYAFKRLLNPVVVTDDNGLQDLDGIIDYLSEKAAVNGGSFNAGHVIAEFSQEPATFINDNTAIIRQRTFTSFESGQSAGAGVAVEKARNQALAASDKFAADYGTAKDDAAFLNVKLDRWTVSLDSGDNKCDAREVTVKSISGEVDGATFSVPEVSSDFTFSYHTDEEGVYTTSLTDVAVADGKKLYFNLADTTEAGTYTIVLTSGTGESQLTTEILVRVLAADEMAITDMETQTGYDGKQGGYLGFVLADSPVKSYIPAGAEAAFAPSEIARSASAPGMGVRIEVLGTLPKSKAFNLCIDAPTGLKFKTTDSSEGGEGVTTCTDSEKFFFTTDGRTMETEDSGITVNEGSFVFKREMRVVAQQRIDLGQKMFTVRIEDNAEKKTLIEGEIPVYLLNEAGKTHVAETGDLSYSGSAEASASPVNLDQNFGATLRTWEMKALPRETITTIEKPSVAKFVTSSTFEGSTTENVIELEQGSFNTDSGFYAQLPTGTQLVLRTGEGQNNYEYINLDLIYKDADVAPGEEGDDWSIRNNIGVKFTAVQ